MDVTVEEMEKRVAMGKVKPYEQTFIESRLPGSVLQDHQSGVLENKGVQPAIPGSHRFGVTLVEVQAGLDLLRSALETLRGQQYNLLFNGALAEGLRKTGQFEEALFAINGAIARATNSGVEFDLPELLRIKSQILAARHDRESAMNCLTEALAVARTQSALAWELRTTMASAGLLCEDGQRDQARHTLAVVYHRFTEGFETADLRMVRALLEDLRSLSHPFDAGPSPLLAGDLSGTGVPLPSTQPIFIFLQNATRQVTGRQGGHAHLSKLKSSFAECFVNAQSDLIFQLLIIRNRLDN
jgi:tetratricopeptide (TPR) repeat protein